MFTIYVKKILECIIFDSKLLKIAVCALYGLYKAFFMKKYFIIPMLIQFIFGFSIFMLNYNFDELTGLHINMFYNTMYSIMYFLSYKAVNPNSDFIENLKGDKDE
jgi:hypothetical protein